MAKDCWSHIALFHTIGDWELVRVLCIQILLMLNTFEFLIGIHPNGPFAEPGHMVHLAGWQTSQWDLEKKGNLAS